jgi:menaquinone-dependent protoporphyrinogen oxidase
MPDFDVVECRGRSGMRVLMTAASRYGATGEIAQAIRGGVHRARLGRRGGPTRAGPRDRQLRRGGARQCRLCRALAQAGEGAGGSLQGGLAARPVWLFSSGPIGNPPKPEEDPVDIADIMQATKAPGHRVFAGKLVKKQLSFPDRAMAAALPVPKAISGTGRRSRPGRQRSPMPSGPDPDRSGPAAALLSAGQDPVAASGHDGVISRPTGVPRGRRRCRAA